MLHCTSRKQQPASCETREVCRRLECTKSQVCAPQVLLRTRAKRTEEGAWVTCSGKPLAGDVVYQTVGGTANTGFLKGSGIPTDARGFIKVCA